MSTPTRSIVTPLLALAILASPSLIRSTWAGEELNDAEPRLEARIRSVDLTQPSRRPHLSDHMSSNQPQFVQTRKGTTIIPVHFELEQSRELAIEVMDRDGHVVRTLADGLWARGDHVLAWYGEDDDGKSLTAGIYSVRLKLEPGPARPTTVAIR